MDMSLTPSTGEFGLTTEETENNYVEYTYDSLGNILQENRNGSTINYSYNALNQLTSKTDGSINYTYSYDNRGNLTIETENGAVIATYTYDGMNRMVSGTRNGETSTYTYNSLNTLTEKNGEMVYSDYNSAVPRILAETKDGQVIKKAYGAMGLMAVTSQTETLHIFNDRTMSPQIVTSEFGAIVGYVDFDPWGNVNTMGFADGLTLADELLNFTGHEYDQTLELYYAQARM